MALAEQVIEDIPRDTFGNRIALIRAERRWNYEQAEAHTGIKAENWRLWEKSDRKPRDYETVCQQIARGAGYSPLWVKAGGALQSSCFAPLALVRTVPGQMELSYDSSPDLALI